MTQVLFNLRTMAQQYARRGLLLDSFEKQVRRKIGSTAGLGLRGLFREALAVSENEAVITRSSGNLRPRPNRDMIPEESKEPFRYRYVMQIDMVDPNGNEFSKVVSVREDEHLLSKSQVQHRTWEQAESEVAKKYWLDVEPESQVVGVHMLNAYWNVSE